MAMTDRHKKICGILVIIGLVIFTALLCWYVGRPMVKFVSQPEEFRLWVDSHGLWGRLAFVGMVIFQIVIAFVPGEPLEIGAGYAFGAVEGTLLCLAAAALGSALVDCWYAVSALNWSRCFSPGKRFCLCGFCRTVNG